MGEQGTWGRHRGSRLPIFGLYDGARVICIVNDEIFTGYYKTGFVLNDCPTVG